MKPHSFVFLALATLFFFSCKNNSTPAGETDEPISDERLNFTIVPGERVGLINNQNCMPEDVLTNYGDLAKADSVYLGEGQWGPGVVLFPDDSRKMAELFWDGEMSKKYPAFIRIMGDSTGSDWKTAEGITVGMDISEVEKLNGSPFTLFGFEWDYGGYVTDYGNGRFNTSMGLRFEPSEEEYSEKIMGDNVVSSDTPEMLAAAPKVSSMQFRILAKEELPVCIAEMVKNYDGRGRMIVRAVHLDGQYHYWLNDGAAAYDGVEIIYNGDCEEICKFGGFREPLECMEIYQGKSWELMWEE